MGAVPSTPWSLLTECYPPAGLPARADAGCQRGRRQRAGLQHVVLAGRLRVERGLHARVRPGARRLRGWHAGPDPQEVAPLLQAHDGGPVRAPGARVRDAQRRRHHRALPLRPPLLCCLAAPHPLTL
ncbi:hypothetical protein FOCC_FOCC015579, partial [Frankliniella occidentalis]